MISIIENYIYIQFVKKEEKNVNLHCQVSHFFYILFKL